MQSTGNVMSRLSTLKGLNINRLSLLGDICSTLSGLRSRFSITVDCIYGYSHSILSGLSENALLLIQCS